MVNVIQRLSCALIAFLLQALIKLRVHSTCMEKHHLTRIHSTTLCKVTPHCTNTFTLVCSTNEHFSVTRGVNLTKGELNSVCKATLGTVVSLQYYSFELLSRLPDHDMKC